MVGLGDVAGANFLSAAYAVSADGSTVVGYGRGPSGQEASRWTSQGGMVGLGDLAGGIFESVAYGVSADGSTVVGQGRVVSGNEAFIWDAANGMRELDAVLTNLGLNLTRWRLFAATAISADGKTIVGWGIGPSGDGEGWLAVIPEPNTAALILTGLLGLAYRQRLSRT
jgi:uncharacterized membrane protein